MKLTNYIRDAVVEAALNKAGIHKLEAELGDDTRRWAEAVADESIGGAEAVKLLADANKKVSKIIAGLPAHLREDVHLGPMSGAITYSFGGCRRYVNEWPDKRPARQMNFPADHPLSVQFFALEDRKKSLNKRRDDLRAEVRAVLASVSTVARLLKVWPEAAELLPVSAAAPAQLPSVNVEHLNAAIGLPTEQQQ